MLRTAAGRLRCILKGMGIAPSMQVSLPNSMGMHSPVFVHTGAMALRSWFQCLGLPVVLPLLH